MKIFQGMALVSLMAVAASPAWAFNLNDAVNAASTLNGNNSGGAAAVGSTPQAAGLLNNLGSQLKVTPQQAVGGTGAMLGLAKNKLQPSQYSELTQKVPGLDSLSGSNALGSLLGNSSGKESALNNTLGNVKSTSDMNSAFSALGMKSGMVSQFAPVILQYLGQQGVGGGVLSSLGSIWGTK
ncbi:DUF2780 domain-containing protein [Pseudomonas sp. dw_358]|uniref:DUF2780 domain-containing protein n=1 Tax=Pseudomonas sp. dw_358 TaxID=2720083 RepID=UPI001BD450B6|nr:DUF2780 domain-containing protein [Pseudomonas sp. dw_358]